ncbi:tyrosine phosphatase family-domain-containing protein [Xylariaceae sp. FL0662B]|nr:tyrosine phosphatase family-domain-containing protein [Xylariaceae sp. FL0662B]
MAEDQQLLPSPPFEHVPGLPNFRDLGGYPVVGSPVADPDPDPDPEAAGKTRTRTRTRTRTKMVRRHLIFRSSEPSRLTADGVARLQALGVERVYDLRSASEIARGLRQQGPGYPVKEWEGARRVFVPVFLDEDYSPEAMALRYRHYLSESPQGTPASLTISRGLLAGFLFHLGVWLTDWLID